jgi:hypothetical protein
MMYMIFNGRIWSAYRASQGWRPYSGADAHTGHVHFSFSWAGAWGRTSFWTGRPSQQQDYGPCRAVAGAYAPRYTRPNPRPCPAPAPKPAPKPATVSPLAAYRGQVLRFGQTSAAVRALQQALRVRPATGYFGPLTLAAVRRFQVARRIPATGTVGPLTWNALVPKRPAPPRPSATALALRRHAGPVLRPGTRSEAVRVVQIALRVRPATGNFGPLTLAAVRRYQVARGIPATGNVGPLTWRSLVVTVH